jgi:chemotaxis protein histidine kinase CheA
MLSRSDQGGFNLNSIAQAEAEVAALGESFVSWALEDVGRAIHHLTEIRNTPANASARLREVFDVLHNIKGQAGTFGYHFVTHVSHIACNVVRGQESVTEDEARALSTCCGIIRRALRHNITGNGGPQEHEVMLGLTVVAQEIARRRIALPPTGADSE